jgi:hypothetical protein
MARRRRIARAARGALAGVSALAGAAGLATPTVARAADPATAQALFDEGRKLMTHGAYAQACPKLEESQKLDPAGGTVLFLAICREHEGRLATAWANYQDAFAEAKRDGRRDRMKIAKERIDVLGPRLPKMRVRVAPANPKMRGFTLTRDDTPVGAPQWGEAVPVDPGTRTLRAEADGHKTWVAQVDVPPEPRVIVVDVPELAPDAAAPQSRADERSTAPSAPAASRERDRGRGDTQRTVGLVAVGVGAVGLGVGAVFGLVSIGDRNEANAHCAPPDYKLCDAAGVSAGDAAITSGNVSTIGFAVGAALAAGGAILYFTAPSADVGIAPTPRGVAVLGRFR